MKAREKSSAEIIREFRNRFYIPADTTNGEKIGDFWLYNPGPKEPGKLMSKLERKAAEELVDAGLAPEVPETDDPNYLIDYVETYGPTQALDLISDYARLTLVVPNFACVPGVAEKILGKMGGKITVHDNPDYKAVHWHGQIGDRPTLNTKIICRLGVALEKDDATLTAMYLAVTGRPYDEAVTNLSELLDLPVEQVTDLLYQNRDEEQMDINAEIQIQTQESKDLKAATDDHYHKWCNDLAKDPVGTKANPDYQREKQAVLDMCEVLYDRMDFKENKDAIQAVANQYNHKIPSMKRTQFVLAASQAEVAQKKLLANTRDLAQMLTQEKVATANVQK